MSDLTTCADVLYNYIVANQEVPWDDLRYMFGEVFYGGWITDAMDRRCCVTYLEVLFRPELLPDGNSSPNMELASRLQGALPNGLRLPEELHRNGAPSGVPSDVRAPPQRGDQSPDCRA